MFRIESDRLLLRPHEQADVDFMVRLNSDPEVVRFTGDAAFDCNAEAAAVVAALQRQFVDRRLGRFVALEKASGVAIGWCGFKWHDIENGVDLGFRFAREMWGRGFATEASRAMLRWLTTETDIVNVFARAIEENVASVRVLEKLGFVRTGATSEDGFTRFDLPRSALASFA